MRLDCLLVMAVVVITLVAEFSLCEIRLIKIIHRFGFVLAAQLHSHSCCDIPDACSISYVLSLFINVRVAVSVGRACCNAPLRGRQRVWRDVW